MSYPQTLITSDLFRAVIDAEAERSVAGSIDGFLRDPLRLVELGQEVADEAAVESFSVGVDGISVMVPAGHRRR